MSTIPEQSDADARRNQQRAAVLAAADLLDYGLPVTSVRISDISPSLLRVSFYEHVTELEAVRASYAAWATVLGVEEYEEKAGAHDIQLNAIGRHNGVEVELTAHIYGVTRAGAVQTRKVEAA